mgnify:FL=1|jgi:hypothetical protein
MDLRVRERHRPAVGVEDRPVKLVMQFAQHRHEALLVRPLNFVEGLPSLDEASAV